MNVPMPSMSWIQAPDEAEQYARGAALGMEQQRIQQEQQRLQAAQEIAQQNRMMEQQKIEIASQYHQQQISLQNQKLEEAKRMNSEKLAQFSRQAAVKMQITDRIRKGEDPAKVWMEMGAQAGMPLSGIASMAAHLPKTMETQPKIVKDSSGTEWVQQPTGHWMQKRPVATAPKSDPMQNSLLSHALTRVNEIDKDLRVNPDNKNLKSAMDEAKQNVNDILRDAGKPDMFLDVNLLPKDQRGAAAETKTAPKSSGVKLIKLEKQGSETSPSAAKASTTSQKPPTKSEPSLLDQASDYRNEAMRQVAGKLQRTNIVKGLWEIDEALASLADIPFNTDLRKRVKKLSQDIMYATE